MNTDLIKELIYAEEFYPFEIIHKKGKVYRITDREFAWVSPFGVYVVTHKNLSFLRAGKFKTQP